VTAHVDLGLNADYEAVKSSQKLRLNEMLIEWANQASGDGEELKALAGKKQRR
jgi:hypothetical protein